MGVRILGAFKMGASHLTLRVGESISIFNLIFSVFDSVCNTFRFKNSTQTGWIIISIWFYSISNSISLVQVHIWFGSVTGY